jgi:hypothetical protein
MRLAVSSEKPLLGARQPDRPDNRHGEVACGFDNLDDKLFPNQFVNARLLLKTLRGVVTVPSNAVQRGAPRTFVYLVGTDDTVSARTVMVRWMETNMPSTQVFHPATG